MKLLEKIFYSDSHRVYAFSDGKIIYIEEIPDTAFSNRLIGDGLAIEISSTEIYSPCFGKINSIAPTQHAFTMILDDGVELLVHIGLNTLETHTEYFKYHVKVGDSLNPDSHILTLDKQFLQEQNFKIIIPIVILNYKEHPIKTMTTTLSIKKGKTLFTYK